MKVKQSVVTLRLYNTHTSLQGVQICASIGQIEPLNSLRRGAPTPGLVLSVGWSQVAGFKLDVLLPSPITLSLGDGITTTPIELGIQTSPVQFAISAGVLVPVAGSPAPLEFKLVFAVDFTGASATGEMNGWWVNPFDISPDVKIGPKLALSVSIIYAQFISTGTPR